MSHPLPPPGPSGDDPERPATGAPYGSVPPYGSTPYGAPQPSQPYLPPPGPGYRQDHQAALTGMILGICSIVATAIGVFLCLFGGAIGVLIGPFGIWQSRKALKEIDAEPDRYSNRSAAVTGQVCSIIGTAIGGIVLLATIALVVVIVVAASSSA